MGAFRLVVSVHDSLLDHAVLATSRPAHAYGRRLP